MIIILDCKKCNNDINENCIEFNLKNEKLKLGKIEPKHVGCYLSFTQFTRIHGIVRGFSYDHRS